MQSEPRCVHCLDNRPREDKIMREQELEGMYGQMLEHNARAFAGQHIEVAYQILAAAMHCAADARRADLLTSVQRMAEEQSRWIDAHAPERPLSSMRARARQHERIYLSLARQAGHLIVGLHAAEEAQKLRQMIHGAALAAKRNLHPLADCREARE
jgi:hypothetical protein